MHDPDEFCTEGSSAQSILSHDLLEGLIGPDIGPVECLQLLSECTQELHNGEPVTDKLLTSDPQTSSSNPSEADGRVIGCAVANGKQYHGRRTRHGLHDSVSCVL